ncbi:MAG: protoporphyrinogen oxidase [Pirellulales bacterium]|nr:protoporphyrinogen oxidase [Pirellulales bacterium]
MAEPAVDVAVIGAGITGLAAALEARALQPDAQVVVLEASARAGGVLQTEFRDGWCLERSADNFITNVPGGVELCRRLGLTDELVRTNEAHRSTYVVHAGRLHEVPEGFLLMAPAKLGPILRTPILSLAGKLRLACEFLIPARKTQDDESLASFVRRRLGRETFERLVQPLVGGIYTADAEQLSLQATLPRFLDMEARHGSLIRAARAERRAQPPAQGSGARYSLFVTPRRGMSSLADAAIAQLPSGCVQCETRVERLQHSGTAWELELAAADGSRRSLVARSVILAVPAWQAQRLLEPSDALLARLLGTIPYADSAIALVGYRREQIAHPLDAFGFVVPEVERRPILACSFSSVKYPDRAPAGHELLRVFLGGAARPQQLELTDDELRRIVADELGDLLGITGDPVLFEVQRWRRAMPQYHLGHLERVAQIEAHAAALPRLALAGSAYRGVGVPHCIVSGETAARQVIDAAPG